MGTPPFMAPEQFRAARDVGPAADVFAAGSVLVYAATGHGPFDADSPYVVAYRVVHEEPNLDGVPAGICPLVKRCLAKEAERRPSAGGLLAALRSRQPEHVRSQPGDQPTSAAFPARVVRRPKAVLALSATVIVAVAGLLRVWAGGADQDSPRPAQQGSAHGVSTDSHETMLVAVGFKVVSAKPGQVKVTLTGKPPRDLIGYYLDMGDGQSWTHFEPPYTFHSPRERACFRVAALVSSTGRNTESAAPAPPHGGSASSPTAVTLAPPTPDSRARVPRGCSPRWGDLEIERGRSRACAPAQPLSSRLQMATFALAKRVWPVARRDVCERKGCGEPHPSCR